MEFGFSLGSAVLIVPRGEEYKGTAPQGQEGFNWKTRFGFVGLNQTFAKNLVSDGMNEKGLVASVLYLPGLAQYEDYAVSRRDQTLGMWELPSLLLGTCATLDEVKKLLPKLLIAQQAVPHLEEVELPLHLYVSDQSGASLVVEYVKGKRYVYDNPLGVLTNAPGFEWHLTNLSNYVTLSPENASPLVLGDFAVKNTGQGSGLLGLPGDFTPPSRFVRAAFFSKSALPAPSGSGSVNLAFHLLNNFDLFKGIVRPAGDEETKGLMSKYRQPDITEWVVVHDHKRLRTYVRTYENLRIQMIDLNKIDFSQKGLQQILLSKGFVVDDITSSALPFLSS
jgi:choloylglycine hydrolase